MEMMTLDKLSGTVDMIVGALEIPTDPLTGISLEALELALEGLEAEAADVFQEHGDNQKVYALALVKRISNLYGPSMDLVFHNLRALQDQLNQATA